MTVRINTARKNELPCSIHNFAVISRKVRSNLCDDTIHAQNIRLTANLYLKKGKIYQPFPYDQHLQYCPDE